MALALGMALKFYTSKARELKLKVRKFLELISMFVHDTGKELVGGRVLTLRILDVNKKLKIRN